MMASRIVTTTTMMTVTITRWPIFISCRSRICDHLAVDRDRHRPRRDDGDGCGLWLGLRFRLGFRRRQDVDDDILDSLEEVCRHGDELNLAAVDRSPVLSSGA